MSSSKKWKTNTPVTVKSVDLRESRIAVETNLWACGRLTLNIGDAVLWPGGGGLRLREKRRDLSTSIRLCFLNAMPRGQHSAAEVNTVQLLR